MDCLRLDKLVIANSPVSKVIVTSNWIVKVGQWPWSFQIVHQGDAKVDIVNSDHHDITLDQQVHCGSRLNLAGFLYILPPFGKDNPNASELGKLQPIKNLILPN